MKTRRITGTLWKRIETLFHDVLNHPKEERQNFLDEACDQDEALYKEVASLLAAHDDEGAFREDAAARLARNLADELPRELVAAEAPTQQSALSITAATDAETEIEESSDPPSASLPRQIGPYRIQRLLGEGGMGTVYLAQQSEPLPRLVALKLIRKGGLSRETLRRFERERRAMAKLSHPSIAQVFDAGTTDNGQPYVVLEHIPGRTITEFCDARRLDLRQRVELIIEVCEGIRYAHGEGLIHRDLKPSNLLVKEVGGKPLPKIIDFGIAKSIEPWGQTLQTASRQHLGSPGYMSPEAVLDGAQTTDERTDVYSLGIVLSQLLVGVRPFDRAPWLWGADPADVPQPPRPSQRLRELPAERRREIAGLRRVKERKLQRQLKGDLDWIVLRAVAHSPADRYPSVAELTQDLNRWLAGAPVRAWPISIFHRARRALRFIALIGIAAISVILMLLVIGLMSDEAPQQLQNPSKSTVPPQPQIGEHWAELEVPYFFGDYVRFDAYKGKGEGWIAAIIFTDDPEAEFGIYYEENGKEVGLTGVYADQIERIETFDGDPELVWADVPHQISKLDKGWIRLRVKTEYTFGDLVAFNSKAGQGRGRVIGFEVDMIGDVYYQILPEGGEAIITPQHTDLRLIQAAEVGP